MHEIVLCFSVEIIHESVVPNPNSRITLRQFQFVLTSQKVPEFLLFPESLAFGGGREGGYHMECIVLEGGLMKIKHLIWKERV